MGSKKSNERSFRAATRIVDVFIGRVENSVNEDNVKEYIKDTFNIDVSYVNKLKIQSDIYNAFKVGVNFNERETLFNAELWPEGIIVDKFHKPRGSRNSNTHNSEA